MESDGLSLSQMNRSSNGCWTCRLRRKKCDERQPVCDACAALYITCYYNQERPEWMDAGVQQEEMAQRIKRQVKDNAHRRRWERVVNSAGIHNIPPSTDVSDGVSEMPPMPSRGQVSQTNDLTVNSSNSSEDTGLSSTEISPWQENRPGCLSFQTEQVLWNRSDNIFLMFYLDTLVPFLFPFYRPSAFEGGKAWILEMMNSSPVAKQAMLCQSSYFFSLTRNAFDHARICEITAMKTKDAFETLRRAIQVLLDSNIKDHIHGAARILASIMHLQRYEIAILSFKNCQVHITASLAIFKQLLEYVGFGPGFGPTASFNAVLNLLGPPTCITPTLNVPIPSAEQAAFRFASALLILDDIISSTAPINLETAVGCQNWVLLEIGEVAALDAWKQKCRKAGNLDVMNLVQRAKLIKESLEMQLTRLESNRGTAVAEEPSIFGFLAVEGGTSIAPSTSQTSQVTRVWGHAALLYLSAVVSGCQPANLEVQYHVSKVLDILTREISPPTLLRTMVWPFCVAGCVCDSRQEARFRDLAKGLQPTSIFGPVQRALEIMENAWRHRNSETTKEWDLAAWFRSLGDPVLLV
ncbi:fungal-specific transcription factor domain-containing protein [Penicillium chermesinum]|uniref:Fungal-specific transcription factor domain-containing protein n=1 Tax=Penicillium chermesinum TaxID=63820 RepID=A0A9W9TZ17_9EURO|nr:fungal-specific transcription factor domain-containing protein [Penicillium chermesinum]KAJ5249169.1 fungal-specific transcription factor domain-containing protein [Penicillium chermesinum]